LRARGVLLEVLELELKGRGLPAELADKTARLLQRCERLRFEPWSEGIPLAALAREGKAVARGLLEAGGES
jgi:hypothetical protein